MAKKPKTRKGDTDSYRHEEQTRKNTNHVGLASYNTSKPKPKKYDCDPHLDPQLIWSGETENISFEVPMVSFHICERIAPEANSIIRSYLELLAETSTRRDALEESYSPVLKERLEEYSNSTRMTEASGVYFVTMNRGAYI